MLDYMLLNNMMNKNTQGQIKEGFTPEMTTMTKEAMMRLFIISILAFIMAWFYNNKCKPVHRILKSVVAFLFAPIYIIVFLIKYTLTNCNKI